MSNQLSRREWTARFLAGLSAPTTPIVWAGGRLSIPQQERSASNGSTADGPRKPDRTPPPLGERPVRQADSGVKALNPRCRVPVSLIIDDSTCLINLSYFAIPHFAEAFPDRYRQDHRKLSREIPDSFVRKFVDWCDAHGVRGKYSVVPYPACVGWVDRDLPGYSRRELLDSLKLIRERISPSWDVHPEMVTHTWVIDTKTGRPYPERTERYQENFEWSVGRSVDELADYLTYALRILKNAGLYCEGVTTPGGFGNRALASLSRANLEACRDVFNVELPHYFRHVYVDRRSVMPVVENVSGLATGEAKATVSIIGGTGDWFGGWDGLERGTIDRFFAPDGRGGRLPELISRGEPTIMVCHWPGFYCDGTEYGFKLFQRIVGELEARFNHLVWMKLSEIARYRAAQELTTIRRVGSTIAFDAPYACPGFTIEITRGKSIDRNEPQERVDSNEPILSGRSNRTGDLKGTIEKTRLTRAGRRLDLRSSTYLRENDSIVCCFDLPKGRSTLECGYF